MDYFCFVENFNSTSTCSSNLKASLAFYRILTKKIKFVTMVVDYEDTAFAEAMYEIVAKVITFKI